MATTSPSPTYTTFAISPTSPPSPPLLSTSSPSPTSPTFAISPTSPPPPPLLSTSSSPQTSTNSSTSPTNATSPSTSSPPPQLAPPPTVPSAPPPSTPSAPPPQAPVKTPSPETSPPPSPPTSSAGADPPSTSSPPPPPPSQSPPPPVSSTPPSTSVPPPSPPPPPPPSSTPPTTSPPPSSPPPSSSTSPPKSHTPPPTTSAPPPHSSTPPTQSTPPATNPPTTSPPPPTSASPPKSSPPPPAATPPKASPPSSSTVPPSSNAPPPPTLTPPASQPPSPSSNHTPVISPPPPTVIRLSPPPPSPISPSTSPPSSVNNTTPSGSGSSGSGGIGTGGIVAIGVGVGIVVLSLIGLIVFCLRKRKRDASGLDGGYVLPSSAGSAPSSDSIFSKMQSTAPLIGSGTSSGTVYSSSEPAGLGNSRPWFTYEELVQVTNGFSSKNLLGEGGFGSVYKGCLPDGRVVAVKQLKIGGGQGEREFKAEVEIIGRIHHRHLVSLVGYCISENHRVLIYEYVPNNTLYFHLHGKDRPVLDWATRVKIAAGAARGIAYLHEDCHPRIIHRDIKSSNILLDNNFEAKVSDFGLAKLALDANTHVTTRVMGTFGYMAPEYASSGKLTEKSDVFSYGVVLLELITGRKPVDPSQPLGDESLVEWARPLLSYALDNEEFGNLVDPRLETNYVETEMFRMMEAAAACVRHSAAKRPRMGQVVRAFDSLATADLTNGMRVGQSEVFNSAEQSAQIRLFRRMAFGSQNYSTDFFSQGSFGSREYTRNTTREQYHSSMDNGVGQIELEP